MAETRLARLRIAGFKSFAEPVSLDILPGLTGIVGPNGCGKSNVVEALRWAMGETSARSLRGGEMDDVIFAGTTARASRNLAEVTITLEGALPAPFEAESELQVTRRIERGAGSQFRANGRELRARDVQTLYADLASGARSSGMVSQGRVSQLVNAKPEERRQVLEEAAGITGLHARRHEAELKLRQAEANVQRAEDALVQIDASREALRKQARQTSRYRNISGLIRNAEAEHIGVLHAQAMTALLAAREMVESCREAAESADAAVASSGAALDQAEAALPPLRASEAEARSILERRRVEAESLAAESGRMAEEAAAAEARLQELEADCEAAARARADAGASVDRLAAEAARHGKALISLPAEIEAARGAAERAGIEASAAQEAADGAAMRCTENAAAGRQAMQAMEAAQTRAAAARSALDEATAAHEAARAGIIDAARLDEAARALRVAEEMLAAARAGLAEAETRRGAAERSALQARGAAERLAAETEAAVRARDDASARVKTLSGAREDAAFTLAGLRMRLVPAEALADAAAKAEAAEAAMPAAEEALRAAEAGAEAAGASLAAADRAVADARAARGRAETDFAAMAARARSLADEAARAETEWAEASAERPDAHVLQQAASAVEAAEKAVSGQDAALGRFAAGRARAAAALAEARAAQAAAEAEQARLFAEADGLRSALGPDPAADGVLAALSVPDGLEAAFAAAFGEAANASLDPTAPRSLRALPEAEAPEALPGTRALAAMVEAPAALRRLLAHGYLLDEGADGAALQAGLPPGSVLVSRAGGCWRWDGQVVRDGAPNPAAIRLAQANRLRSLLDSAVAAGGAVASAQAGSRDAEAAEATAAGFEEAARAGFAEAERALRDARAGLAALAARAAQADARLATLTPMVARLRDERAAADAALQVAEQTLRGIAAAPDPAAALADATHADAVARQRLEEARNGRTGARIRLGEAQSALSRIRDGAREAQARFDAQAGRLAQIEADLALAAEALAQAEVTCGALGDADAARAALAAAEEAAADAASAEQGARAAREAAEVALDAAKAGLTGLRAESLRAETLLEAAAAALARAQGDERGACAALDAAEAALGSLPHQGGLQAELDSARAVLEAARARAGAAQAALAGAETALRQAETGQVLAVQELAGWRTRLDEAETRHGQLAQRRDAARAAVRTLGDAPAAMAARAEASAAALAAAGAAHAAAQEGLAEADQRLRALALARRDAELGLATRREAALRAEAAHGAAEAALRGVLARAAERLGEAAALPDAGADEPGSEEKARRKLERLTRERDEMGPVNLRADLELAELDERAAGIEREREELSTAIAKLRGSIGHLNREGRQRLEAVFTQVDQHFRTLFTRMMGGGRAHLALTGNEDPLQAGLEIYAEPPGKKLSTLSLLSGGEQALTALSLIFAVFRCTPAPVSVLDEVDAPLDDANVERFCTLLDDVVRETGTRFLVVTHHQLTMSRMDRLFGVTMQERGVSRLLSVDLQRAAAMVEPALQAAE